MYLSKFTFDLSKPNVLRDLNNCCEMHRSVMAPFPGDGQGRQSMGIQYRLEGESYILVQSQVLPDPARCPAGYAIAGVKDVTEAFRSIGAGEIFRFSLLANPSYRETHGGNRHMRATRPQWLKWLREKGKEIGGFVLEEDDGILTAPRRVCGRGRDGMVTLGAVLYQGVLQVSQKELFRSALEIGIGQGKSYGLGLLSIAKVFAFSGSEVSRPPAAIQGQVHPVST